jgi:hypothetical protein
MIGFGLWQGRLSPVIRRHHRYQAGVRRERLLMQSDLEMIATRKNQLVPRSISVSTNRATTDFFGPIRRIHCFPFSDTERNNATSGPLM